MSVLLSDSGLKKQNVLAGPRLATKGDMCILEAQANAKETVLNMANQYKTVKAERDQEAQRKYPNQAFLQRCDKIMNRLLPAYQKVYGC